MLIPFKVEIPHAILVGLVLVVVDGRAMLVAAVELLMITTVALSLMLDKDVATHCGLSGTVARTIELPATRANRRKSDFSKVFLFIVVLIFLLII